MWSPHVSPHLIKSPKPVSVCFRMLARLDWVVELPCVRYFFSVSWIHMAFETVSVLKAWDITGKPRIIWSSSLQINGWKRHISYWSYMPFSHNFQVPFVRTFQWVTLVSVCFMVPQLRRVDDLCWLAQVLDLTVPEIPYVPTTYKGSSSPGPYMALRPSLFSGSGQFSRCGSLLNPGSLAIIGRE